MSDLLWDECRTNKSLRVGIVGAEASKFTIGGALTAQAVIHNLLSRPGVTEVISGGCHLGGVDIWAAQIGRELGLIVTEHLPKRQVWEGGYKQRNLLIAGQSNELHCITVNRLPEAYTGMRFETCYHCAKVKGFESPHIKSGGCWTMHRAHCAKTLHVVNQ